MKKKVSRKSRAVEYAARELRIVPLHTIEGDRCSCDDGADCTRPGKHPITRHGVKDATTTKSNSKPGGPKIPAQISGSRLVRRRTVPGLGH